MCVCVCVAKGRRINLLPYENKLSVGFLFVFVFGSHSSFVTSVLRE